MQRLDGVRVQAVTLIRAAHTAEALEAAILIEANLVESITAVARLFTVEEGNHGLDLLGGDLLGEEGEVVVCSLKLIAHM